MASEELIKYQDDIWSFDNIKCEKFFFDFYSCKERLLQIFVKPGIYVKQDSRRKGGEHVLFHFITSNRSQTFGHLFATLHVR